MTWKLNGSATAPFYRLAGITLFTCLAIKGLLEADEMPFEPYVQIMQRRASSQVQRHTFQRRAVSQRSLRNNVANLA